MTLASLLLGMLLQIGRPPRAPARTPVESRARDFVTNFAAARYDMASKDFNEAMRESVTPAVLTEMKRQSDYYLGPFRSVILVRQKTEKGFRIVEIVSRFGHSLGIFRVTFDPLERIGALQIDPIANEPVEPVLEATARAFVRDFVAGDFRAATKHFDPTLLAQLTPSKLAAQQAQVSDSYGAFRSIKEVHQITEDPYRTIDLTTEYEHSAVSIRIAFNRTDRMTAITLEPIAP